MTCQRQVFFIGGFDPKSSPHYHRMYRDAVNQRPTSARGEHVEASKQRTREGLYTHWDVRWQEPGQPEVQTRYTVLGWHDIVQAHWPRTLRRMLPDYLFVYGRAGLDGTFAQVRRAAPAAFWLALFPLLLCLSVLLLSTVIGYQLASQLDGNTVLGGVAGLLAGIGLWRILSDLLDSEWLLRLYGFTFDQARQRIAHLEERIDQFADQLILAAQNPELREILLVGHSTGTMLATQTLARALEKAPHLGTQGPALSLLTLGQCIPILGFQPPAHNFRQQLARLADTPQLTWVDYSAPSDWAVFAGTAPWMCPAGRAQLLALSPRFHLILNPERYQTMLRWHRRHELHLQYLRAPDLPGGYDPVTLTAGPLTLAEQHTELLHAPCPRATVS